MIAKARSMVEEGPRDGARLGCRAETKKSGTMQQPDGTARARNLRTPALCIQRHAQEGRAVLKKVEVDGDHNVADLRTKHVDGKRMWRRLGDMEHREIDWTK